MMLLFNAILVPMDGSTHSMRALEMAVRIAQKFGAKITFIHVYSGTYPMVMAAESGFLPPVSTEWFEAVRTNGQAILTHSKKQVETKGIHVETSLKEGHAVEKILETCNEGNFDLIVIGARGLSPIKELFLGSVSHGVTRYARCPVLVVK